MTVKFEDRIKEWKVEREMISFYKDALSHSMKWNTTTWIKGQMKKAKISKPISDEFIRRVKILVKDEKQNFIELLVSGR